jgi:aminopeptidase N
MLLEELIGEEAFTNATKDFIETWNGKHPAPYDFFNIFNKYAGRDINWFWKACYFEYGYADLSIKSVDRNKVIIERKGNIPVSIKLEITYDDNSKEAIYKNLSVWETGRTEYLVSLKSNKTIRRITLGDRLTPDIDLTNNTYQE